MSLNVLAKDKATSYIHDDMVSCLCVCVRVPRGTTFVQGARPVTSDLAQRSWDVTGEAPRDALVCTCKTTVVHAVYFLGLLPWSFS